MRFFVKNVWFYLLIIDVIYTTIYIEYWINEVCHDLYALSCTDIDQMGGIFGIINICRIRILIHSFDRAVQ